MSKPKQLVLEFYIETYAENAVKEAIEKGGLAKEVELLRTREKTNREAIEQLHCDLAELSSLLQNANRKIEKLNQRHREDVDSADWWKSDADDEEPDAC